MSTTWVRPGHRIIIPKDVAEKLHLEVGDALEAEVRRGKLVFVPKRAKEHKQEPERSPAERRMLARIRRKLDRIRTDLISARGLTPREAELAAEAGLITTEQRWWWTEQWQRGERQAERELRAGRTKAFGSAEDLIRDLRAR